MPFFSQRKGIKTIKSLIQVDSIDDDLRNGLWNEIYRLYVNELPVILPEIVDTIWTEYYKKPIDESPPRQGFRPENTLRNMFFNATWDEVYDLLECIVAYCSYESVNERFIEFANIILGRELSAYRFVDNQIAEITSEQEIISIDEAITNAPNPVRLHLQQALEHFADRKNPDYRNSIKESISAVESICKQIANNPKTTLGRALDEIAQQQKITIHPSLLEGFKKLYSYTSDANGIRHALMDEPNLSSEDAKFMLVSCSAFINYLIEKAQKAGIKL